MKKIRILAALLATAMALSGSGCAQGNPTPQSNIVSSARYIGQARGFLAATGARGDFPTTDNRESQQQEPTQMVRFAADNKLNSIFFQARGGATAYYQSKTFPLDRAVAVGEGDPPDPLATLCKEALGNKVQVFAVIDPYSMSGSLPDGAKNPFEGLKTAGDKLDPTDEQLWKLVADDAAALAKRYDVAGVVLDGLDAAFMQGAELSPAVEGLVRAVSKAVLKAKPTAVIGVSFDAGNEHNALTVSLAERLAGGGVVSMVIPRIDSSVENDGPTGYLPVMRQWAGAALGLADLYTLNTHSGDTLYELHSQLLANAMQGGVTGAVVAPYRFLLESEQANNELLVSLLAAGKSLPQFADLTVPQTLAVAYPQNGATVYDNTVYLMGTSDPALPLTVDGREVERMGSMGTFGVALELSSGENTFTLKQGERSTNVKVVRGASPSGTAPITKITTGSLFPLHPLGVDSNEAFSISCTGPAGASITATLNGTTIVMSQPTATKTAGAPTLFQGSFTMNPADYPADKVTNAGAITYVVGYNGSHEVQKSAGEVFVAGKDVPLVLEIGDWQYVASVLTDASHEDNFVQSLKSGGRARIVGKTRTTRSGSPMVAYKLSGGGYVTADKVAIVQDTAKCSSNITEITTESGDGWEQYTFAGGQPAVLADQKEAGLTLRFLDTKMTADPVAALVDGMAEGVQRTDTADGVQLELTFAAGELWGYDIIHEQEATKLFLRRAPKRSGTFGKPLEGIQILLDPGHGGPDPGALGVAGQSGPTEAVLNLAVANAAKFRLEQLGAQVTMTRVDESIRVSLDERTFQAEREHPHIFLAIHHNSTALVKDLKDVRRMEAYYWEGIAKPMAGNLMNSLGGALGRKTIEPENAYYYVTRLTFAPAVLFEMGFVVNPAEYEQSCRMATIYKAANGIAQAILQTIPA